MNNFGQLIVDSIGLNRNAICSGDCAIKCNIVSVVLLVLSIPDTCQFFCNYRQRTPKMYLRTQVPVILRIESLHYGSIPIKKMH